MDKTGLQATDDFSAARSTHPRVSLKDIENAVTRCHYFTAGQAIKALGDPEPSSALDLLTICVIELENGWTAIGKSAPASPENFDEEKGRSFAYDDAVRQLWPLFGFALREKLRAST